MLQYQKETSLQKYFEPIESTRTQFLVILMHPKLSKQTIYMPEENQTFTAGVWRWWIGDRFQGKKFPTAP